MSFVPSGYEEDDHEAEPNDIVARLRTCERRFTEALQGDAKGLAALAADVAALEGARVLLGEAAKTIWKLRNGYGG